MVADNEKRIELVQNYILDANDSRMKAQAYLDQKKYKAANSKIFGSMYSILLALGMNSKFEAKSPDRLINWFKKKFVITDLFEYKLYKTINKSYTNIENEETGTQFKLTENEVIELYSEMNDFVDAVKNHIFPKAKRGRKPKSSLPLLPQKIRRGRKPKFVEEE